MVLKVVLSRSFFLDLPKNMNKLVFSKFLSILFSAILSQAIIFESMAQEKWDLQKCIEYSLQNNLQIKQSNIALESSLATEKFAKYSRLPSLSASVTLNNSVGRTFDVFTNQPVEQSVTYISPSMNSNVLLYGGGRINQNIRRAATNAQASGFSLLKSRNDVILAVASAYLQVVFSHDLVRSAKAQKVNADQQFERTQSLIRAGSAPENAIYDLITQQANAELQLVTAENTQSLSYLQLKQALQIPLEQPFEILIPELEPQLQPLTQTVDLYYTQAENFMPEIKAAQLLEKAAEIGIRVARAELQPSITAFAQLGSAYSSAQNKRFVRLPGFREVPIGYTKDPNDPNDTSKFMPVYQIAPNTGVSDFSFRDQLNQAFNYGFGAQILIPIFNRFQTRNSVTQAKLQWQRSQVDLQLAKNNLRRTIELAYNDVQAAEKTFLAQTKRRDALKESLRVMKQRFENGAANSFELSQVENQYNISVFDQTRAKYDYFFKLKVIEFYSGKEIKF
jgi:outer membrane protein